MQCATHAFSDDIEKPGRLPGDQHIALAEDIAVDQRGAEILGAAFVFRHTILPGTSKPLMIELPQYRIPGVRTALLHTFDRAKIFVQQAGTIILAISLVLWALSTYPKSAPRQVLENGTCATKRGRVATNSVKVCGVIPTSKAGV